MTDVQAEIQIISLMMEREKEALIKKELKNFRYFVNEADEYVIERRRFGLFWFTYETQTFYETQTLADLRFELDLDLTIKRRIRETVTQIIEHRSFRKEYKTA